MSSVKRRTNGWWSRACKAGALMIAVVSPWVPLSSAEACQACACGDASFAIDPSGDDNHVFLAQIYASKRPEKYGIDGYPYDFDEWRADLTLAWAWRRSTVSLRMPWLWRTLNYQSMELAQASGLGDVELSASWVFARSQDRENAMTLEGLGRSRYAAIHGGLSMPTARGVYDERGDLLPDDVQPGTGSFMPFIGVNWAIARGIMRFDGRHTGYFPVPGRFEFQVGPTLQNRVRVMVEPVEYLQVGAGVYTSLAAPIRFGDEKEQDTGGFAGYLDLEAEVTPTPALTFVVGGRIPVIQALRGYHRAQPSVFFGVRVQGEVPSRRAPDLEAGGYIL